MVRNGMRKEYFNMVKRNENGIGKWQWKLKDKQNKSLEWKKIRDVN